MKLHPKYLFLPLLTVSFSCSNDNDDSSKGPQQVATELQYSNGNLDTGNTTASGTVAPSGYSWSEILEGGIGFLADDYVNTALADDFTVPDGEVWDISDIEFYAYQTDYVGNVSSVNNLKIEIYNSDPAVSGAEKIFGDWTTNRFTSSTSAKLYVTKPQYTGTTREVFKLNAQVTDLVLTAGTYWIVWASRTATNAIHYYPPNKYPSGIRPGTNNAMERNGAFWNQIINAGYREDFPFNLKGSKIATLP